MPAELLTEDIRREFEDCVRKHSWETMSFSEPRQVLPGCWIIERNDPPSETPISIVWSQDTGCHEVHGGICQKWREEGGENGRLGLPMSDEEDDPESDHSSARRSCFQHGTIHAWLESDRWSFKVDKLPPDIRKCQNYIKAKLSEIDIIVQTMGPVNGEVYDDWKKATEIAGNVQKELKPYLDAFESQAFFIVTFGMLKAGKSTLVNTLVGKRDVSPVGHGCETTKRSSILVLADQEHPEGVYLYKPTDWSKNKDNAEWLKERCAKLLLALGGVGDIKKNFEEKRLSSEKIYDLLTKPANEGELPPVIRIKQEDCASGFPNDNLLKDGVAILDTPGLDGIDANAEKDAFWQILPAQGDFFLLVQSSMSGLNENCAKQIANIYGMTENKPGILIVYNEISSQFWLTDGKQEEVLKEDQKEVEDYLRKALNKVSSGAQTDIISVNAGAASAALFGDPEMFSGEFTNNRGKLLEKSRIGELSATLQKMLQTSRTQIKISRLKGLMGQQLAVIENEIDELRGRLETARQDEFKESQTQRNKITKKAARLCGIFHDADKSGEITKDISERAISEFNKNVDSQVIDNLLKNFQPQFVHRWPLGSFAPKEKCVQAIGDWVESVNSIFANNLKKSVAPGHAILQAEPWKHFSLPTQIEEDSIEENFKEVSKYLGNSQTLDDFRKDLLSLITPQGIKDSVSYQLTPADTTFPQRPLWECAVGLGNEVEKEVWDGQVRNVKSRIKSHFFEDKGYSNGPAADSLADFIRETILQKGRDITDDLQNKVMTKVGNEQAAEAIWKTENEKIVNKLTNIQSLVKAIHDKLKEN